MTDEKELLASYNELLRTDTGAWFESPHCKIWKKDRSEGLATPKLNYLQFKITEVIRRFEDLGLPIRIIGLKPRQKGSTTYFSAADYCHLRREAAHCCVIGGQLSQTKEVAEMLKTYNANDTFRGWGNTGEIGTIEGRWTNGSRLKFETAGDRLAGIAGTYQVLHATEVARWAKYGVANASEVLANILKCVPNLPRTMIILESTAEGACYDDQTDILTSEGWKRFADLTGKEGILTKDPETNQAYYQHRWKYQKHKFSGKMVRIDTRTCNLVVTPNHRMWTARQKGPWKFIDAREMLGKTTDYRIDRGMKWSKTGPKSVTVPRYGHIQGAGYRNHRSVEIPIKPFLEFLGHFLSDGHSDFRLGTKKVTLTQVKYPDIFRASAQAIASILKCKCRESEHGKGRRFEIINAQFAAFMCQFSRPKRIPRWLMDSLSANQCRLLLKSLYDGDGSAYAKTQYKIDRGMIYAGLDETLVNDIQELALKAGYATSASGPKRNRKVTFTSSTTALIRHDNPPTEQEYDGNVYCVTLPKHHLLMVRRGGTAVWCGNSGDYYNRWLGAIDGDDFLSGKATPQPGQYVRVFAPWFEFSDSAMRLTEEQKRYIEQTLDDEDEYEGERELIELYATVGADGVRRLGSSATDFDLWEQLAWRRWAIREECKRDKLIFDRDYPKNWQTAFQKSGDLRFNSTGMAQIRRHHTEKCVPMHGIIEGTKERRVAFRQTERGEAKVTIFEKPIRGCRYILSVDPMTGETQVGGLDPDRHGAFVLRAGYWDAKGKWHKMATAARVVPCRWDIDVLEETVWGLARYYGNSTGCKIAIEMNQDKGITELLKLRGADLYQREIFNQREERMSKALGYQTNEKTRETLIERLAQVIREWDKPGDGIAILCDHAMQQCENFVRKPNGRSEHAEGWHDDDVLGIALGVELIEHATTYVPRESIWMPPELRDAQRRPGVGHAFT